MGQYQPLLAVAFKSSSQGDNTHSKVQRGQHHSCEVREAFRAQHRIAALQVSPGAEVYLLSWQYGPPLGNLSLGKVIAASVSQNASALAARGGEFPSNLCLWTHIGP